MQGDVSNSCIFQMPAQVCPYCCVFCCLSSPCSPVLSINRTCFLLLLAEYQLKVSWVCLDLFEKDYTCLQVMKDVACMYGRHGAAWLSSCCNYQTYCREQINKGGRTLFVSGKRRSNEVMGEGKGKVMGYWDEKTEHTGKRGSNSVEKAVVCQSESCWHLQTDYQTVCNTGNSTLPPHVFIDVEVWRLKHFLE